MPFIYLYLFFFFLFLTYSFEFYDFYMGLLFLAFPRRPFKLREVRKPKFKVDNAAKIQIFLIIYKFSSLFYKKRYNHIMKPAVSMLTSRLVRSNQYLNCTSRLFYTAFYYLAMIAYKFHIINYLTNNNFYKSSKQNV